MDNNKKEIAVSLVKSALSNIPVVGQLFSEILFEYNGRIKQERLNRFIEIINNSIEDSNPNFNIEKLKSEDFGDLLENLLKKSMYAKTEEKLVGFKNILLKGMMDDSKIERCEIFAGLLSQVSNKHIEILSKHRDMFEQNTKPVSYTIRRELESKLFEIEQLIINEDFISYPENLDPVPNLEAQKLNIEKEISEIKESLEISKEFRVPDYYKLSKGDYLFYLQDLSSKALLIDEGVGGIETEVFDIMVISDLGLDFLKFVEDI